MCKTKQLFKKIGHYSCRLEPGDALNFLGVVAGIVISIRVAVWSSQRQAQDSGQLNSKIKNAEIVMTTMNQLAECRGTIIRLAPYEGSTYFLEGVKALSKCRHLIAPSIAGLKVLNRDLEYTAAKSDFEYLIQLDRRIFSTIKEIQDDLQNAEDFSVQSRVIGDIVSIVDSQNIELATITEMENRLTTR